MADYDEPRDRELVASHEEEPATDRYPERERSRSRSRSPDRDSRSGDRERYDRRSISPRGDRRDSRDRERGGGTDYRDRDRSSAPTAPESDDEEARNEGTNLFVTGLSRSVNEQELEDLFAKYGNVDRCQIMLDPHTRESRGFGFVNMTDVNAADQAMQEIHGKSVAGRTLSVEKAKRKKPRTPTPGKYFGPPKPRRGGRGGFGGPPRFYDDRFGPPRYRDWRGPPPPRHFHHHDDRRDDYYRRPRYDDRDGRDRFYRDRGGYEGGGGRGGGRFDDRYPPRDYRGGDRYDARRPSRDDRVPPRDRDRDTGGGGDDYRERDRDDYR